MIRCLAVQLRPSKSGTRRAEFAYFNAAAEPFAKSQIHLKDDPGAVDQLVLTK
jgi:hypothetical protein